jgi:hypothetical protein
MREDGDQFSPHLDWYEGLDAIIKKLKEEIKERWRVEQFV